MRLTNLDVTLRDGGYRNSFNFPRQYAIDHAALAVEAGFDWVEIAYRNGSFNPNTSNGLTGRGEDRYIADVTARIGADHVALIAHPHNVDVKDLESAYAAGARLIRLCVNANDPALTWNLLSHARSLGFVCAANLTRVSNLAPRTIAELAGAAAAAGANALYLADSNGAMQPADVTRMVTVAGDFSGLQIGFHAHNNIGLALANAIAAVSAGASWIDSSVLGMGKGAGNLIAEQWISYLDSCAPESSGFELAALLDLSALLSDAVPESAPVVPATDLLLGRYNLSIEHKSKVHGLDSQARVRAARDLEQALSA